MNARGDSARRLDASLIGLAGGIDKDGSRAGELLAAGFGGVEFGTVTAQPIAGGNPGIASLAERLAGARRPGVRIGIGVGLPPEALPETLAVQWLVGLEGASPAADYVSFSLSAKSSRFLLEAPYQTLLEYTFHTLAQARDVLAKNLGRPLGLAVKLPLGDDSAPLPAAIALAAAAGFDRITAVLTEDGRQWRRLAAVTRNLAGGPAVVAVGGLRCASDVRRALAAGAVGVQVHRLFVEFGAACLPRLLAD